MYISQRYPCHGAHPGRQAAASETGQRKVTSPSGMGHQLWVLLLCSVTFPCRVCTLVCCLCFRVPLRDWKWSPPKSPSELLGGAPGLFLGPQARLTSFFLTSLVLALQVYFDCKIGLQAGLDPDLGVKLLTQVLVSALSPRGPGGGGG